MFLTAGDNTIIIKFVPEEGELATANIIIFRGETTVGVAGVDIYIDNQYRGITNSDGLLLVSGLSLGYHSGRAEKAGYITQAF